jgi:hypothetical protein
MEASSGDLQVFWKRARRLAHLAMAAGALALLFAMQNGRAAALGLILGGSVSVLRFALAYRMLNRPTPVARVSVRLVGYALSGAALAAAFAMPELFWPWSTVAGLLLMNVCIIAAELLGGRSDAAGATAPRGGA